METSSPTPIQEAQIGTPAPVVSAAPATSQTDSSLSDGTAKAELKALLTEARNTRDMLVGFRNAVESGMYAGVKMLDLAKGIAFLEAILKQNNAHIHNLQERIG